MNRKILFSAIVISSFFLMFLGMRNPYLSGSGAPKPRPRAVVENSTKNHLEVVQQLQVEDLCPQEVFSAAPDQGVIALELAREFNLLTLISFANPSARASPLPLSLRS